MLGYKTSHNIHAATNKKEFVNKWILETE